MEPAFVIALLMTGIGVGFASGLLGVGGCFIMIPVQYWILTASGVDATVAIRVAFGTNLLVVLPTAISGAIGHSKKGSVLWRAGVVLGVTGAFSSLLGGYVAAHLPGRILTTVFGFAILAGAVRMLTAKPPKVTEEPTRSMLPYFLWGIPLGFASGLIGIGGGVFSYIIEGLGVPGLPEYSVGYVNLLQWILLAGTSIPMAQIGVRIAHKLPAKQLKYVFIAVMIYMGLKMMGVFSWLHLPI